MPGRGRPC